MTILTTKSRILNNSYDNKSLYYDVQSNGNNSSSFYALKYSGISWNHEFIIQLLLYKLNLSSNSTNSNLKTNGLQI